MDNLNCPSQHHPYLPYYIDCVHIAHLFRFFQCIWVFSVHPSLYCVHIIDFKAIHFNGNIEYMFLVFLDFLSVFGFFLFMLSKLYISELYYQSSFVVHAAFKAIHFNGESYPSNLLHVTCI